MIGSYRGFDKRLKYLFDNATEVSYERTLSSGTPIGAITIDGTEVTIYAPSGGGGSSVSYTPIVSTGTKIGILSIDGVQHDVYTPEVTANPLDASTAELDKLKVGSVVYDVVTETELQGEIATLQASFQDGVDSVYDACVAKGSTPSSTALSDVVDAIYTISTSGTLGTKTITQNGVYNASSDGVDGYSRVTVDINASVPFIMNDNYMFGVTEDTDPYTLYADTGKYYIVVLLVSNSGGGGNPTLDSVTNGTLSQIGTVVGDSSLSPSCVFRVYLVEKTDETLDSVLSFSGTDNVSWIPLRGNPTIGTVTKNDDVSAGQFTFTANFTTPTCLLITGHRIANNIQMNDNTVRMCSSGNRHYICAMGRYNRYIFDQITCIENDGSNQATVQLRDTDIERVAYCYFPLSFS